MAVSSRLNTRQQLAEALEASPLITIPVRYFDHKPISLQGLSPVLAVESSSSIREPVRFAGAEDWRAEFDFIVHHFVKRPDRQSQWTKQQADEQLDQMEFQLFQFVQANQNYSNDGTRWWDSIVYASGTIIDDGVEIDGNPYIDEQILLRIAPVN